MADKNRRGDAVSKKKAKKHYAVKVGERVCISVGRHVPYECDVEGKLLWVDEKWVCVEIDYNEYTGDMRVPVANITGMWPEHDID